MSRTAILLLLWLVALGGLTLWGHTFELFYPTGVLHVFEVFWGKLVLADFASSLVLIGAWIAYLHPPGQRLSRGLAWGLGVLVLGTPLALIFFLLRSRHHADPRDLFLRWPEAPTPAP